MTGNTFDSRSPSAEATILALGLEPHMEGGFYRRLKTVVMGSDIIAGQCLQLHVPGGVWKASQLTNGLAGYGLISEAVSPGFDFADMELGSRQKLGEQFPEHSELIEKLMV